jgi:6-phosphogluconolactonase/glucosamine-6-phosphate isomerase/deaminase
VLRAAKRLAVLVSGPEKAGILREVLTGEPDEVRYPIHVLWPVLEKVLWLVDRDAAAAIR